MVGFIFGGNTGLNYEDLQNRRAAADALAKRIMGQQPKNVGEGIGALLQGAAAGIGKYRADKGLKEGREQASTQFNDILSKITGQPVQAGGNGSASIPISGAASEIASTNPASGNGSYRDAIASIESAGSGDYSAIGPTNSKLGRPLGRYQIMEANIGPWSQEALGKAVSPEEFLKNPELQDKVFDHKFQGYVEKFGPEGAAQAWLGGPGSVGKTNRKDVLGTSVGEYGSRFMNALGPQQVASLDSSAGMQAPQTAAQAIETQAPMQGGSLSDEVADWRQTPEAQAQFPGRQSQAAAPAFDVTRFGPPALTGLEAGLRTQAAAYGAAPQQPNAAQGGSRPVEVASSAPPAPAAPQQAVAANPAQAQPRQAQPYQIDPQVLQFLSSPFADEGQKQSVRMMLQQQMQAAQQAQEEQTWRARQDYASQQQQSDPLRQAQIAEANAQVRALQNPTRPITDDERRAWGITDNRPYAMTPKGPEPIGGSGQTINIGGQIEARKQAAEAMGLTADDPRYMGYVLGGDMPKESQQNLTAIDKKAVLDALDQVQASRSATEQLRSIVTPGENGQSLNDRAGSGALADWQSWAARNDPTGFFDDAKGQATTELTNTVLNQALGSLKSIFGAAPTEGERQILMDMQASVDKTPAERKIIIDKAVALAERRQQFNQERADEIRGNTFYKPKPGAQPNVETNPPRTVDEATGMPSRDAGQRGPRVGTIEDGYRFKGGNPSDPNNWEQVR